jgi:hypothetical protein
MSAPLTLTTAGRAALINAAHTGTTAVTIAAIGLSATAITPTAAMTTLAGEIKRVTTIGGTVVDAATIHVTMEDESTDAYSLLSFALYLSDGTLFALYGQAAPIYTKTAASMGLLAADIAFPDISVAAITFSGSGFTNPPASTTIIGVTRFATAAEAKAGNDNTIAVTPLALELALMPLLLQQDGAGSGLDADLWQGKAPSAFVPSAMFQSGSNSAGYWRTTPDGAGGTIIEQWGAVMAGETDSPWPINFPVAFISQDTINLQVTARTPNNAATNGNRVGGNVVSDTQFNVFCDDGNEMVFWRAVGW